MGARSIKEARACYTAYLRRSVGICATRQNAVLKERALGICAGAQRVTKLGPNVELDLRAVLSAGILLIFVLLHLVGVTFLIGGKTTPTKSV